MSRKAARLRALPIARLAAVLVAAVTTRMIAELRSDGDDGRRCASVVVLGKCMHGASIVADHGTLHVGSDRKKLLAISPKGAVAFRLELAGEVDTAPALARAGTVVVAAGSKVVSVSSAFTAGPSRAPTASTTRAPGTMPSTRSGATACSSSATKPGPTWTRRARCSRTAASSSAPRTGP